MDSTLLIVTPQASFGTMIHDGLNPSSFEVFSTSDFSQAVHFVRRTNCKTVLLDTELEDVELSVLDIGFALRQIKPDIQFVVVVSDGQDVDIASLSPVATLSKPISMPDLTRLLERITLPGSTRETMDGTVPASKPQISAADAAAGLSWLTDVSKAAQQLTQLNLESSAQAAFITRSNELWAYAGQLSREAAQELTDSIQKYWDAEGQSDLLRFVRLKSTEAQHMLYVRKLSDNMNLALVFDAETPFSTIRSQAGKLVKNLFDSSSGEKKPTPTAEKIAPPAPQDLDNTDIGETLDIPPISELLGEVPPPNPPKQQPENFSPSDATVRNSSTSTSRPEDPQEQTLPGQGKQFSIESSPSLRRNPKKQLIPANDETVVSKPSRQGLENQLRPGTGIPDDLQATRKQERHVDPQSLVETRVQSVGDAVTEAAHRILIEPPSLYQVNLTYACLLVPRFEHHHLVGDAAARLNEWVPQICVAYGWRLEYISIRPEYLQWIVRVPLAAAAGKVIYTIRKHTSDRFFNEFPRFRIDNPSGEFWAPGFIVQGGSQPHPQKQVRDFIKQTRVRQGLR
ncbi:MAG TPA: transposase [Anaerolineales bacterium]|jgi:REP element-mobilizing transposase RayT/ActR/RegA family two-component response regulator